MLLLSIIKKLLNEPNCPVSTWMSMKMSANETFATLQSSKVAWYHGENKSFFFCNTHLQINDKRKPVACSEIEYRKKNENEEWLKHSANYRWYNKKTVYSVSLSWLLFAVIWKTSPLNIIRIYLNDSSRDYVYITSTTFAQILHYRTSVVK